MSRTVCLSLFKNQTLLDQVQRDENVETLLQAIHDAFDLATEANSLSTLKPESSQAKILKLMLQHICKCGDFIKSYAKDIPFCNLF